MIFNSIAFVLFFPAVTLLYFAIPVKARPFWLLFVSFCFYMFQGPKYALLLFFSILSTYTAGRLLERFRESPGRKKAVLAAAVILNLGLLFLFKYLGFFAGLFGVDPGFSLLLPVGISFYVFQVIGYTADVFRGTIPAERNFFRYALFVSFFPQILSGPIGRAPSLLPQLDCAAAFDYGRIRHGLLRMLWGYFLKLVVVSRLTILTDLVFQNYSSATGVELLAGSMAFSIQIYCDFAGYSILAAGSAEVLGIRLTDNFRQPFLSASLRDLWRRWHISLMSWFRDYVYIPLGGGRRGPVRKHLNTLIVFTLSGLWHGAALTYIIWGFLSGLLQVAGTLTLPFREKAAAAFPLHSPLLSKLHRLWQVLVTFLLFTFTVIFFKSDSLEMAVSVIRGIFTGITAESILAFSPFRMGLGVMNFLLLCLSLGVLFLWDYLQEKTGDTAALLLSRKTPLRWAVYYFLTGFILLSANIGAARFIYFQF